MMTESKKSFCPTNWRVRFIKLPEDDDGSYDIVITDLRMPGLDGKGVVQHIRKSQNNSIPIIGISGTPWLIQDSGFDVVLPKPFPLLDLVESVNKITDNPSKSAVSA